MNFAFSEEQELLREQAARFLREYCAPNAVRAVLEGGEALDKKLWDAIAEMGWTGAVIPEAYGGHGMGYLELCVLAEELGRALAPLPTFASMYLASEALILFGSEQQKRRYLPELASGAWIGSFAFAEAAGVPQPKTIETAFSNGTLSGSKAPVPYGHVADFAIVLAKSGNHLEDLSLCLVDLHGNGVARSPISCIDPTRPHGRVVFSHTPAESLGEPGEGWNSTTRLLDRAAILVAFEQVGGAEQTLEMARLYSLDRFAFGRPIGSFQAIKHKLADLYVNNVLARSNAYFGAWALATEAPEMPLAAAGARISATKAFDLATQENIQLHGGVGFTWEHDCHLYYRRARELALCLGSARHWKERLVSQLESRAAV